MRKLQHTWELYVGWVTHGYGRLVRAETASHLFMCSAGTESTSVCISDSCTGVSITRSYSHSHYFLQLAAIPPFLTNKDVAAQAVSLTVNM